MKSKVIEWQCLAHTVQFRMIDAGAT